MKIAILQSNYIPWKGYFDLINAVDVFVLYDCVQYTKNDWRNRNQVLVNGAPHWLTIPVRQAKLTQLVQDTQTTGSSWARKHWATLQQSYARARGYEALAASLQSLYEQLATVGELSRINRSFIEYICAALEIRSQLLDARELIADGDRNERLVHICQQLGAHTYVSGPAAQAYLDTHMFKRANIDVEWFEYGPYAPYPQASQTFSDHMSVLDLLLNTGDQARHYYRGAHMHA